MPELQGAGLGVAVEPDLISDAPARCLVRVVAGKQVPATYYFVGKARFPDLVVRRFFIAADHLLDAALWSLPRGEDLGPVVGYMAKVRLDGEIVCGGYDDEIEDPKEYVKRHGFRVTKGLVKMWKDAGVLMNPA